MERMYYVTDKNDVYYVLSCASYGFSDEEETMSSTNDIIYCGEDELLINQYVKFDEEIVVEKDDKLFVSGKPTLYSNDITDEDRQTYDLEFDLSIKAFMNNDEKGIQRWNDYLKSYEEKFMAFKRIETEKTYEEII